MKFYDILGPIPPEQETCNFIKELADSFIQTATNSELLEAVRLFITMTIDDFNDDLDVNNPIRESCFNDLKRIVIDEAKRRNLIPGLTTATKVAVVIGVGGAFAIGLAVLFKKASK